jgi:uncharacterized repeat protein (TIGR03843 family)
MDSPNPSQDLQNAFKDGEIELQGQFMLGSNYTFLVEVRHQEQIFAGVYKPQKGTNPLWDFPAESLAWREVAAYILSEFLGWGLVPYTTLREDGPYGPGSLQKFIEYNPNQHYFNFRPKDKDRLRPVALFDHLVNNADRKGSHVLLEKRTRHLYAIDHGLCFHAEDKLRTVIWDFAGQDIAPAHLDDIRRMCAALETRSNLFAELEPYLNPEELTALAERGQVLLAEARFPQPPQDRRAFPYPPL